MSWTYQRWNALSSSHHFVHLDEIFAESSSCYLSRKDWRKLMVMKENTWYYTWYIMTHSDTLKNKDPKNIWKNKNKQPQPLSQKNPNTLRWAAPHSQNIAPKKNAHRKEQFFLVVRWFSKVFSVCFGWFRYTICLSWVVLLFFKLSIHTDSNVTFCLGNQPIEF